MKSRLIASLALGVSVALGATGCSFITPQATAIPYSPSDGITVPTSGPLEVRNAFVVADETGARGNLIAAIVNDTTDPQVLNLTYGDTSKTVRVPASSVVSLGSDDTDPLLLRGIDTLPGANLTMSFQSGDATGVEVSVPVVDGALPYYTDFVPGLVG